MRDQVRAALATEFYCHDLEDTITVRQWLVELLLTLWEEEEEFSGKRPFGNSGWTHDPVAGLVKAGLLEGKIDEDGYVFPEPLGYDELIVECILALRKTDG